MDCWTSNIYSQMHPMECPPSTGSVLGELGAVSGRSSGRWRRTLRSCGVKAAGLCMPACYLRTKLIACHLV